MQRVYETTARKNEDGSLTIMARRQLRYYTEEKGHHWAEKAYRMPFDHALPSNPEEAVRRAWPEATSVTWAGDTVGGTLWLAVSED